MRSSPARSTTQILSALMMACALGFSFEALAKKEKTAEQYWLESGMNLDILINDYFVSNPNCNSDLNKFQACYEAVAALGEAADPKLLVLPHEVVGHPAIAAGPVRVKLASGLVVADMPDTKEKVTPRVAQEKKRAREEAIRSALKNSYTLASKGSSVDFVADLHKVIAEGKIAADKVPAAAAAALSAYVATAIDSHARVEAVAQMQDQMNDSSEQFFGIGAVLRMVEGEVMVQQVLENSPASKSGLQANDIIAAVNGETTENLELSDVVKKIRGLEDTEVVLDLKREKTTLVIKPKRGKVVVQNVKVETKKLLGEKYLVVKLASFTDKFACNNIEAKIAEETMKNPDLKGVIIDVRDNGGGLMQQAVCIGSLFVGQKTIVKSKDLDSEEYEDYVGTRNQVTRLPLVTLINSNSASASEILAGAIQDYQRGWIVGETSFGKGSVQAPEYLTNDIYLFKTISRFYQPSGRTNQIVGIQPDFSVPEKVDATEDERFSLREADIFPNALEAVGEEWVQPRPSQVTAIEQCRSVQKAEAEARGANKNLVDYTLLVAAEVLACDAPSKSTALQQN